LILGVADTLYSGVSACTVDCDPNRKVRTFQ